MKTTSLVLLSALALASSAAAGPLVALPVTPQTLITPSALFRDQEWFFDGYGSYLNHREVDCSCDSKHDGWGGGFAVGHYFAYYVGARLDVNFSSVDDAQTTLGGDILLRFPIAETHLAPYAFVGGGVQFNDSSYGFFRVGGGLEWRFTPHFGIFAEGSYAWLADDNDSTDVMAKVGLRYSF